MALAPRTGTLALLATALALVASPPAAAGQATSLDRCIAAIASDLGRFVDKSHDCLRACEDGRRNGSVPFDARCRRPSNHAPTQACLLRAQEQITGSKSIALRRCVDDEVALFYQPTGTCPGKNDSVTALLQCLAKKADKSVQKSIREVYRPERPPVCGDGQITGYEQCDPYAYPTGCSPFAYCHPQACSCIFAGCGNGIIEYGEDCDYYASPNGCSFEKYCDFGCSCRSFGSATAAFLRQPESLLE